MNNFVEITSNDAWFKLHPEKIAGVEFETTSFYFPIQVKGTKEDVLRVTGMGGEVVKQKEKSITVPVLRYKANGNDLIETKKTINNIEGIDNAFIVDQDQESFNLVLKLSNNDKSVYFVDGNYNNSNLERITKEIVDNSLENKILFLKNHSEIRFISKMYIEIAKQLGFDYKKLEQIRDAFYKQKKEKEDLQKVQKDQQKIELEKKEIENTIKKFIDFADGNGTIDYDDIEILIKENNLEKPHIRTIGSLRKRSVVFKDKGNSYTYERAKGTPVYKISTSDHIFKVIEQLKEIYKQPDNSRKLAIAKAKVKAIKIKLQLIS
jgi:hypothetical protein